MTLSSMNVRVEKLSIQNYGLYYTVHKKYYTGPLILSTSAISFSFPVKSNINLLFIEDLYVKADH